MRITILAVAAWWTAVAAAGEPANFDRAVTAPVDDLARVPWIATAPSVRWPAVREAALPLSPLSVQARPEAVARAALAREVRRLRLPPAAADSAVLKELQDLGRGPVIARFRQSVGGIEVQGRELNFVMDRDLRTVAVSGEFFPFVKAKPDAFVLPETAAVRLALRDLAGARAIPPTLTGAPRVTRVYYPEGARLVPAYRFALRATHPEEAPLGYAYVVSARDGAVLIRKNLTARADFTYRTFADASTPFFPYDGPYGNGRVPFTGSGPGDELPRVPVTAPLVTLQNGPITTNDPWLEPGALATSGNNVDAYADLYEPAGYSSGDLRPTITGTRTFDHVATADAEATSAPARRGGVVNLFYVVNYLHDWWYGHGFDEAAGNAQQSNYGRGGVEGDPLRAESQNYWGFNNATMYTPPDGQAPIMQMLLYRAQLHTLTVQQPDLGLLANDTAGFGPQDFDLSGYASVISDGVELASDGCEPFTGASGIVVLDRGSCVSIEKARNAEAAGAAGVVIVNDSDQPFQMSGSGSPAVTIPVMSVGHADGETLKSAMAGGAVQLHLYRLQQTSRDSALDNAIVAHEFFHYVSNRLVGDGLGLENSQGRGMGEGWSDFASTLLVVRPEDVAVAGNEQFGGAYGQGLYVYPSAYFGARRAPYSTRFSIDPLTFRHIEDGVALPDTAPLDSAGDGLGNSESHATGEVWANVLWEVYAALLNDPRSTFEEARSRMMDYLIAALKITPLAPTLLDGRDAMLAVAQATDAGDHALMAAAFARRGMGAGARAPDARSSNHAGVVESYVGLAGAFAVDDVRLDLSYEDGVDAYCDTDGALDPGETALLTFGVVSTGTRALEAGASIALGSDGHVAFLDGNVVMLPALGLGERAQVSARIRLNSAAGTAVPVTFTAEFPQAGASADEVLEPEPIAHAAVVNLDLARNRNYDDVELAMASEADWTAEITEPVGPTWAVEDFDARFGTGQAWHGADNGGPATSTLTSGAFSVTGAFSVSFQHYFQFEEPDFDGGVIEVSLDGGAWQDAVAFGAVFTQGNGYNSTASAFNYGNPRAAFANTNGGLEAMTLDFGVLLAGHGARLRFRIDTDTYLSEFGWLIDDITFNGAAQPAFSTAVTEDGVCENRPVHADAGPDQSVNEEALVTLAGTAHDPDGSAGVSYHWTQLSGPAVTLTGAASPAPQFPAPQVSGLTAIVFGLETTDGSSNSLDEVTITVRDVPPVPTSEGGNGSQLGGGFGLGGLALLLLAPILRVLRRRLKSDGLSG